MDGMLSHSIDTKYTEEDWLESSAADAYYDGWVDGSRLVLRKALYRKE
jgi:hypothetical protein